MIPKNTSSELVCDMIGDYYDEIAARKKHNAAEKWFARREDREPELLDKVKTINYLRGILNTWKTIMKLKREVFLEHWKPLLKTVKSETDKKFNKVYNLNKRKVSVNE